MPTLSDLRSLTDSFLDLHWPEDVERPAWSESPWRFVGEIPQQDTRGCYALLAGDAVLYVGVGAGRGSGIYEGAGLGARLHRYWRVHPTTPREDGERRYAPTEKYAAVDGIATVGFGGKASELWYLAYALEPFLISRLNPEMNAVWNRR